MATTVGALSVDLALNSAEFIANTKKAADATTGMAARVGGALDTARTAVSGFLGAFVVERIMHFAKAGLDHASALGEQAQQLGVTTRELQVYRYAATQVGIEQETMDKALARLTLQIGRNHPAFKALGIEVRDASGELRTAGELMPELADAIAKIPDPAARAAAQVQLFGKSGQQLDTLLAGGSGAIDELSNAADRLGVVLSDDAIAKADETADKLAAVQQVLTANIATVVTENADAILYLADAFVRLVAAAGRGLRNTSDFFAGFNAKRKQDGLLSALNMTPGEAVAMGSSGRFLKELMAAPIITTGMAPRRAPPAAGEAPAGGGGGGARSRGRPARAARSGPTLAEEFGRVQDRLDPGNAAANSYSETIALLDRAEAAGLRAAGGFDALRQSARADLFDQLGMEKLPPSLDATAAGVADLKVEWESLTTAVPRMYTAMGEALDNAKVAGVDGLISGLESLRRGFGSLEDVALSVFDSITSAMLETLVYAPLRDWAKGGGTDLFGGFLGSLFDGARARGGAVDAGGLYLVGEEGPEAFAPGMSGTVIPAAMLRRAANDAGGPAPVVVNFYGPVSNAAEVRRSAAQAGAALARQVAIGGRGQ